MPTTAPLKHGDFTDLAHDYSRYREGTPCGAGRLHGLAPLPAR